MSLTLTTHDTRFDAPDGATIAKVLASLDGGQKVIATLERSELSYVQAQGSAAAGFGLEYQEGSLDQHYRSAGGALPLARVTEIFQMYARGAAAWREGIAWEQQSFVPVRTPWFSTWWGYVFAILVVALLIWWWRG